MVIPLPRRGNPITTAKKIFGSLKTYPESSTFLHRLLKKKCQRADYMSKVLFGLNFFCTFANQKR